MEFHGVEKVTDWYVDAIMGWKLGDAENRPIVWIYEEPVQGEEGEEQTIPAPAAVCPSHPHLRYMLSLTHTLNNNNTEF